MHHPIAPDPLHVVLVPVWHRRRARRGAGPPRPPGPGRHPVRCGRGAACGDAHGRRGPRGRHRRAARHRGRERGLPRGQPALPALAAEFPALNAAITTAVADAGAKLAFADNLCMYGPTDSALRETTPQRATDRKGQLRDRLARGPAGGTRPGGCGSPSGVRRTTSGRAAGARPSESSCSRRPARASLAGWAVPMRPTASPTCRTWRRRSSRWA